MPHDVERLAEFEGDDDNIRIGQEHIGDYVKESNYCSGGRTGRSKGILISERHCLRRKQKGWVEEVADNGFLHDSSQNWCDGDGSEISMLLWRENLGNRSNASLLPLLWDCGGG